MTDISHDFRTPLSIIGMSTYLLGKATDPDKQMKYIERIGEQIARLIVLMDSFVELVDLEEQASSLQFQPVDLAGVIQTLIERYQPEITDRHQEIAYQERSASAFVIGDPTALTKVISNVIANAIHYTPDEGNITLRLDHEGEMVVVEVADTGIGIPTEDLTRIFESFYRVDSARSTESGGAGLGLTMAKKLVELMKGQIDVESTFGTGSVFRIYLPIYPQTG